MEFFFALDHECAFVGEDNLLSEGNHVIAAFIFFGVWRKLRTGEEGLFHFKLVDWEWMRRGVMQ
jgi:hypothetical protein